MGKWYAGKVAAYDGRTAKHTILYKDGDVQKLTLRHEAVVWPDVPGLDGPGLAARQAGEADAPEVRLPRSCCWHSISTPPCLSILATFISTAPSSQLKLHWLVWHA